MSENLMDFGQALRMLKLGKRIARKHWKNVECIYLVGASNFKVNRAPLLGIYEDGTEVFYRAHIDAVLKSENGDVNCCVWTASQGDVLAEDWFVYE